MAETTEIPSGAGLGPAYPLPREAAGCPFADRSSAGIVDVGVIAAPAEADDRTVLDRAAAIRAHPFDVGPAVIDRLGRLQCHGYASANQSIALSLGWPRPPIMGVRRQA
jgi:hypothetical protein